MRFNFPLVGDRAIGWHPVLPVGPIEDVNGNRVTITREYLQRAVEETERYYSDLKAEDRFLPRPVIHGSPHVDSGRRSGDLIGFAVSKYRGTDTLLLKIDWSDDARGAMESGTLQTGSVRIVPKFKDKQSGRTYGPFIREFSETAEPAITNFRLTELLETPEELANLGLTLSENTTGETMTIEDLAAQVTALQNEIDELKTRIPEVTLAEDSEQTPDLVDALNEAINSLVTDERTRESIVNEIAEASGIEVDAINAILSRENAEPTEDQIVAIAQFLETEMEQANADAASDESSEQPDATATGDDLSPSVAASESGLDPEVVLAEIASLRSLIEQNARLAALPTNEIGGGSGIAASENNAVTLQQVKKETGLGGIEAVKATKAIAAGNATIADYKRG